MIRQFDCQSMSDDALKKYGSDMSTSSTNLLNTHKFTSLYEQGWRTCFTKAGNKIASCHYDTKRIEFNLIALQSISESEVKRTIIHEIAHALVGPGHGHGLIWIEKAKSIGLPNPELDICGHTNLDAGRSVKEVETKPKRQFNRINKPCPICGLVAEEVSSAVMNGNRWVKLKCGHLVKHETIVNSEFDFNSWESESGKRPFPFQIEGIKFLEQSGGRALIADEPGLGKTIQALGFGITHQSIVCPILWVCKTTLKLQALKEALDWGGISFVGQIIENPRSYILPNLKLYIISMDLLRNMPTEKLESIGFKTVVADEIQHFKNPDSSRTAELRKLVSKADYFIPLSGTPWKNRGQEYFPVLNMLDPTRFPSYESFKNRWVDTYVDRQTGKMKQGGIRNIPAFREFTKDLVIRRMRDDVLPDLPKINRQIRFIDMEALHQKAYEKAEAHVANLIKAAMIDDKPMQSIAAEIMILKHITGLAKVKVAIEDTIEFLEQTDESEKITLFHHHIDVGDNLQNGDAAKTYDGLDKWLSENGFNKTLRLYGGRNANERNEIIESFKRDKRNRVLIASTLASGEGLNIQFCQNAMMIERQWNPANEEQAELRFSRPLTYGDYPPYLQEHLFNENKEAKKVSVRVPYLIADQTVDSMLTDIVERKRLNFRRSMNDKDINLTWEENDVIKELAELIIKKRYGKAA